MGFFGDVFGGGKAAAAADNAAQLARFQANLAEEQLGGEFERVQGQFDPFIQAGAQGLQGQQQGATIGGFDERLGDIFGSQNFQNLVGERTRAVQGQLAAGGLTRSGTALEEIANVPTELGFGIENQLFGRQQGLAGQGLTAAGNLGQFGSN